jgi:hypothetical protein
MPEPKRSPERVPEDEELGLTQVDQDDDAGDDETPVVEADEADGAAEGDEGKEAKEGDDAADEGKAADGEADDEDDDDDAAVEKRARAIGWRPRNEWRGKPQAWRPAREYLDKAYANKPVFEERIDRMSTQLEEVQKRLSETTDVLKVMSKRETSAWERGYKAKQAELLAAKDQAIEDGDKAAVKEAEKKLAELDEERAQVIPAAATGDGEADAGKKGQTDAQKEAAKAAYAKAVVAWKAKNPWFGTDPELSDTAEVYERRVMREQPNLTYQQRLDAVAKEVRRRHPGKFQNPRRDAPNTVNGGRSNGGSAKSGRTYADLPADAKAMCDKFVKTIPGYKRDDYVKTYEW